MSRNDDSMAGSPWTRRALLGMGAAVPALVVPALAGPVATAEARRRPRLGSGTSMSLAPVAQLLDPGPNGVPAVRFSVVIVETDDIDGGVDWAILGFSVNGVDYTTQLKPGFWAASQGTFAHPMDADGLDATGRVTVQLTYRRASDAAVTLPSTVAVRAAQAFGGGRPPRPH